MGSQLFGISYRTGIWKIWDFQDLQNLLQAVYCHIFYWSQCIYSENAMAVVSTRWVFTSVFTLAVCRRCKDGCCHLKHLASAAWKGFTYTELNTSSAWWIRQKPRVAECCDGSCTRPLVTRCQRCRRWTCHGLRCSSCVKPSTSCVFAGRHSCIPTCLRTTSARTISPSYLRFLSLFVTVIFIIFIKCNDFITTEPKSLDRNLPVEQIQTDPLCPACM